MLRDDSAGRDNARCLYVCGNCYMAHIGIYEPPHDKTNKMACAPSDDSDQPEHPPSQIRVFTVRMKKAWVLSYPLAHQAGKDSERQHLKGAFAP